MKNIIFRILLFFTLFSFSVMADYEQEWRAVGGKRIHNIITSASELKVYYLKSFNGVNDYKLGEGKSSGEEIKHMLTHYFADLAIRNQNPKELKPPDYVLRFSLKHEFVDALISTEDGCVRVIYRGKLAGILGELDKNGIKNGRYLIHWISPLFYD
jgi:hypothetical protein